jgi:hypothetical protein
MYMSNTTHRYTFGPGVPGFEAQGFVLPEQGPSCPDRMSSTVSYILSPEEQVRAIVVKKDLAAF